MSTRQQPPPVQQSAVAPASRQLPSRYEQNKATVEGTLRANGAAEAKAIRAMFAGDKRLADRFLATAFKAMARETYLLENVTPISLIDAIMTAAALGLEPFTDELAIVPQGGKAQVRVQYRGYLKRIRNSGKVLDVDCQVVYERDEFALTLGTDPQIHHVPFMSEKDDTGTVTNDRGGYRGFYAWALMPSGTHIIEWMEEAEINHIRDTYGQTHSKDGKPLPWATAYSEMGRKTVIRRLSKRLPGEAVDMLLRVDAASDELERELKREQQSHQDDLRDMALRAVGAGPVATPPPDEAGKPVEAATPEGGTQPETDPMPAEFKDLS